MAIITAPRTLKEGKHTKQIQRRNSTVSKANFTHVITVDSLTFINKLPSRWNNTAKKILEMRVTCQYEAFHQGR